MSDPASSSTSSAAAAADVDAWVPKDQWDPALAVDAVSAEEQALWAAQERQEMFGESPWQRFKRLAAADPLVPGGLMLTALVLGRGLTTMGDRNQARGQWFMRARIAAQALTLAACVYSMYKYNRKAQDAIDARTRVYATDELDADGVLVNGGSDNGAAAAATDSADADAVSSKSKSTPTAASPFEREWTPPSSSLLAAVRSAAAASSSTSASRFSVARLTAWPLSK